MFWLFGCETCKILAPQPGIKLIPMRRPLPPRLQCIRRQNLIHIARGRPYFILNWILLPPYCLLPLPKHTHPEERQALPGNGLHSHSAHICRAPSGCSALGGAWTMGTAKEARSLISRSSVLDGGLGWRKKMVKIMIAQLKKHQGGPQCKGSTEEGRSSGKPTFAPHSRLHEVPSSYVLTGSHFLPFFAFMAL